MIALPLKVFKLWPMLKFFKSRSNFKVKVTRSKIVAASRGMHVSPAKHSYASVTDGQTDRQTMDKVIPMCRYASQATQKLWYHVKGLVIRNTGTHVKYESPSS